MALPLSKQALILITVPLVFELALGGLIQFLLAEMDKEHVDLMGSMKIGTLTRTMIAYGVERMLFIGMNRVSKSELFSARAKLCALRAGNALDELSTLMDSRKESSPAWLEIKEIGHNIDTE